jgi:site-specific recombinase XerD
VVQLDLPTDDALVSYLADCRRRGLRPATVFYYETAITRFAAGGGCPTLADFTRNQVRDFQDNAATLSAGSKRGYLRALRTFSTWLFTEDLLDVDRLANLALPRVDRHLVLVPSEPEILALLDAANPPLRVVIALLAGTGLRISDVSALDVPDLKVDRVHVQTTKNRGGRIVPLDDALTTVLQTYLADLRPRPRLPDDPALFLSRTGRRLTPGCVRLALTAAARRAQVSVPLSPHVLRHWFARDLAAHDTTDRLLSARMGWTSTSLMARYAPVSEAELVADTQRYSPLQRMADGGGLARRLPSNTRGARRAVSRSNSVTATARSAGRTR